MVRLNGYKYYTAQHLVPIKISLSVKTVQIQDEPMIDFHFFVYHELIQTTVQLNEARTLEYE